MHGAVETLVGLIHDLGYPGIFILMAIESSLFPFPSEAVMIPAGYLAYKGDMNVFAVFVAGLLGSLAGAFFNYWLAITFGRGLMVKFGKYVFLTPKKLDNVDAYFLNHGEITTFNGRLIPGIRQLISLPAGLARMPLPRFTLYTSLGAGIWLIVLIALGYFLGANEALLKENLRLATIIAITAVAVISVVYVLYQRKQSKRDHVEQVRGGK